MDKKSGQAKWLALHRHQISVALTMSIGIARYFNEFTDPYWIAYQSFWDTEYKKKLLSTMPWQTFSDYMELFLFNCQIWKEGYLGMSKEQNDYLKKEMNRLSQVDKTSDEDFFDYWEELDAHVKSLVYDFPKDIEKAEGFGFDFSDARYQLVAETPRFSLYQVLPWDSTISVNDELKPVIIIHPYVLGGNILAFDPDGRKSYVHAFANAGVPTYFRSLKDISNPEVQIMSGEDDALDTKYFCHLLKEKHGQQVTLNGFCQGGFIAALDILSGELDGLVDALITCVAPMDGTRSEALTEYMNHLPQRYRDLDYSEKYLSNGNAIVAGNVMSWVYKLKSMYKEAPGAIFFRELSAVRSSDNITVKVPKTAAYLLHWIKYDRADLPRGITMLSFLSYTEPVSANGTLPVGLFGRTLNFSDFDKKNIKYLLCYAEEDDLVDRPAAIVPAEFADVEVTVFPKGHGSIATSWSHPASACALHLEFEHKGKKYRGPVKWQMDLSDARSKQTDVIPADDKDVQKALVPTSETYVLTRGVRRVA